MTDNSPHILVVDDETDIRELVQDILVDEGYDVAIASNGELARQAFAAKKPDLVLLDIWMPDVDGITLLKEWNEGNKPVVPVIMMSGHGTVETAVEATRIGAFDFLEKPLSLGKLLVTVKSALNKSTQMIHNHMAADSVSMPVHRPIGRSQRIQRVLKQVEHVAAKESPVVIFGEPGVGKTYWAKYLHSISSRRSKIFHTVDAIWLSEDDAFAILFGYEHDGIVSPGLIEQVQDGILLIENASKLSKAVFDRLTAAISSRFYLRAGGIQQCVMHARLLFTYTIEKSADNEQVVLDPSLQHLISIHLPPLREYLEDVPEFLNHFVKILESRERLPYRMFSVSGQNKLRHYSWPGNFHEMYHLVKKLLMFGGEEEITLAEVEKELSALQEQHMKIDDAEMYFKLPLRDARDKFEKMYLLHHLQACNGNVGKVALVAGMERTHLYRKIRALDIDLKQGKSRP